jgi:hypothetical protein
MKAKNKPQNTPASRALVTIVSLGGYEDGGASLFSAWPLLEKETEPPARDIRSHCAKYNFAIPNAARA